MFKKGNAYKEYSTFEKVEFRYASNLQIYTIKNDFERIPINNT